MEKVKLHDHFGHYIQYTLSLTDKLQHYYLIVTNIKICSYTYRNLASTPLEVRGARRMTRHHTNLSPVFLQGPQLVSSSQENQQKFNLFQGPRTCRSKTKGLPLNHVMVEWTFMIKFRHL